MAALASSWLSTEPNHEESVAPIDLLRIATTPAALKPMVTFDVSRVSDESGPIEVPWIPSQQIYCHCCPVCFAGRCTSRTTLSLKTVVIARGFDRDLSA
jgi:hypothetical protein